MNLVKVFDAGLFYPAFLSIKGCLNRMFPEKSRILVTGSTGLLGVPLVRHLRSVGYDVKSHGRGSHSSDITFDLCDWESTRRELDSVQPKLIINLVALTNVDQCEKDRQMAYRMNVKTVENLVRWVEKSRTSTPLIHLSTDQVYDGPGEKSEEVVTLINTYAWSKYCAEQAVVRIGGTALRTNFFGKSLVPTRTSFTDWAFNAFQSQTPTKLFTDVYFSPLSIKTLCVAIERVAKKPVPGIYNLGSRQGMSKAEFVTKFVTSFGLSTENASFSLSDSAGLSAPRPKDMRMNSSLFEKTFLMSLPTLSEEIERVRNAYEICERNADQSKEDRKESPDLLHC